MWKMSVRAEVFRRGGKAVRRWQALGWGLIVFIVTGLGVGMTKRVDVSAHRVVVVPITSRFSTHFVI